MFRIFDAKTHDMSVSDHMGWEFHLRVMNNKSFLGFIRYFLFME